MKVFHKDKEKGKEVGYVQLKDIAYIACSVHLLKNPERIPASIFITAFNKTTKIDSSNQYEFVKFDKEYEVDFFRKADFIIDYMQYREMTDEQLQEEKQKLADEGNCLAERWNEIPVDERRKYYKKYKDVAYMVDSINEVFCIKHRKLKVQFPEFVVETRRLLFWKKVVK